MHACMHIASVMRLTVTPLPETYIGLKEWCGAPMAWHIPHLALCIHDGHSHENYTFVRT